MLLQRILLVITITLLTQQHLHTETVWTWYDERWGNVVGQINDRSCGIASLLTILHFHYRDMRYDERKMISLFLDNATSAETETVTKKGFSFLEISKLARLIGYETRIKLLSFEELKKVVSFVPVIVYLEIGERAHFAVVRGISNDEVWLADPSRGNVIYSSLQFMHEWRISKTSHNEWHSSGGLCILRQQNTIQGDLLEKLNNPTPQSLLELRRRMILHQ